MLGVVVVLAGSVQCDAAAQYGAKWTHHHGGGGPHAGYYKNVSVL